MTFLSLFPTIMEKTFVAQLAQDSRWLFMWFINWKSWTETDIYSVFCSDFSSGFLPQVINSTFWLIGCSFFNMRVHTLCCEDKKWALSCDHRNSSRTLLDFLYFFKLLSVAAKPLSKQQFCGNFFFYSLHLLVFPCWNIPFCWPFQNRIKTILFDNTFNEAGQQNF
jgi:hypothetical protein